MAHIIEEKDGKRIATPVPSESRCLKEIKQLLPGAHFVRCKMTTPQSPDKPVPCVELRYHSANSKAPAPVCAVPVDPDPNSEALTPLVLIRHVFRSFGYEMTVERIGKDPLDQSWVFRYEPIKPSDTATTEVQPDAPKA